MAGDTWTRRRDPERRGDREAVVVQTQRVPVRRAGSGGSGRDPADLVAELLGEPDVSVGSRGDGGGPAVGRRDRELRDVPRRRHAADLVGGVLREPQVSVGTGGDFCPVG